MVQRGRLEWHELRVGHRMIEYRLDGVGDLIAVRIRVAWALVELAVVAHRRSPSRRVQQPVEGAVERDRCVERQVSLQNRLFFCAL